MMQNEDLILELAALIRRLESRMRMGLTQDRLSNPESLALESIEDAIIGLVLLHIKLRSG